ncbi:hypothetical protein BC629DRAFT_566943 [Irpex lacteus]|nr:hypothetical protein BC629DRAFT_566943 [Irpex lacteus]
MISLFTFTFIFAFTSLLIYTYVCSPAIPMHLAPSLRPTALLRPHRYRDGTIYALTSPASEDPYMTPLSSNAPCLSFHLFSLSQHMQMLLHSANEIHVQSSALLI